MISAYDVDGLLFSLSHSQATQSVMILNMYDVRFSRINYISDFLD